MHPQVQMYPHTYIHIYIRVSVYMPHTRTHTLIHKLTHIAIATATFPLGAGGGGGQMAGRTHDYSLPPLLTPWQLLWTLKAVLQNRH